MKRHAGILAFVVALGACGFAAQAQQGRPVDFDKIQIRTTKLADNLYVAEAAPNIGNVVFLTGPEGVLVVDTMNVQLHEKLIAAIRAAGGTGPIRFVINTHLHGDHTAGNALFAKDGAVIIAHENELKRMSSPKAGGGTAAPKEAWPTKTYSDRMTLRFNGEEIEIIHPAPAHTDDDSIVWFKHANVMHVGDLPGSIRYNNIGIDDGGTVDGMIAGGELIMKLANPRTKLVSGHLGPLAGFKEIRIQNEMTRVTRDRVAKLMAKGKTLQQIVEAKPTADFDEGRLGGSVTPERWIGMLYADETRGAAKPKS